ncbi:MAG: PAS domain S-box protein [Roseivirga sp.]|nr:PAS domain S-box protein [Roseivirga sp.]
MIKPEKPENEAERLSSLNDYHILDTLPEQAYDDIATIAAQICGVPIALISLIDENRQWIKARHGIPSAITELPREISCCAHTILEPDKLMEVEDASKDKRFEDNPLVKDEPNIQYYAGAALTTKEGVTLGTLCVIDHSPNKLTEAQGKSLMALSRQVMALLELRKETQDFDRNKSRFQELAETISDVIYDLDEVGKFTYVNPALAELTGYTEVELLEKAYYDLVHPDAMEGLGQFYYQQIKVGSDSSYYEFPIVTKDGEVVWLGQTVKIFFDGDRVQRVGAVAKDVTELKRVRKELEESESLYRLLSENSKNMVCLQATDGSFTYASPSTLAITGFTVEEFLKSDSQSRLHPEDVGRVAEEFVKVLKGEDRITQYRYKKKSGDYIWIETVARPILEKDGRVSNIQTSSRDISLRKKNEERIRREEANLKALIENSTDIIWSIDKDFRYITFNTRFHESLKSQIDVDLKIGDEVLFRNFPEKAAELWRNLYNRAFNGERFIEEMRSIGNKDIFYECSFNPIIDEYNQVIGVSVFARDVSERVRVEMKRQRFQQGLAMLNELSSSLDLDYSELIEKAIREVCLFYEMEQGILCNISGDDYVIRYVVATRGEPPFKKNDKFELGNTFCEITHEAQEIVAINNAGLSQHNQHPCHQMMGLESYLGSPLNIGKERYGTLSLSSKTARSTPFDNYDKEFFEVFARWVGAILERRNYEKLLLASKENAENASMAKANFLSTISHEIRTPLNAIIGMTHILMQDNPKKTQLENLNILKFSGENLLVLVNDVLDINKIESGKLLLEQSDFNLKELLESIRSALIYSIEEKGLESKIHYDTDLPEIMTGDSMRIAQVLNNLLSNAIKFTRQGTISILAENRGIEDGMVRVYLEVQDSGIGLSEKELHKIFQRFTQARSSTSREYGGSGLGLSIVKGLLELMDSEIRVESSPESGSKFYFELLLPLAEETAPTTPVYQPNLDRLSISNINILLVEDNKVNQLVAEKFLNKWGVEVTIAENGQEAVDIVKQESFSLILMDLQMPVMDGYEATRQIRKLGIEIPILALTASVRIGQKKRALRVGMNDFLIKPLTPSDLYNKLAKYISEGDIGEKPQETKPYVNTRDLSFQALREMLQGDDDFKAEVVPLYIKNIQSIKRLLPLNIEKGDIKSADRLRHKMLTTLHTLEATTIRSLVDDGIALIGKNDQEEKMKVFVEQLGQACHDMEKRLEDFLT